MWLLLAKFWLQFWSIDKVYKHLPSPRGSASVFPAFRLCGQSILRVPLNHFDFTTRHQHSSIRDASMPSPGYLDDYRWWLRLGMWCSYTRIITAATFTKDDVDAAGHSSFTKLRWHGRSNSTIWTAKHADQNEPHQRTRASPSHSSSHL